MDLEETSFESVENVFNEWNIKQKLWNGQKEWDELFKSWIYTKFKDIAVEEIQELVNKFDKLSNQCANAMKENVVA